MASNNDLATMHFLSKEESYFFKCHLEKVNEKLLELMEKHDLPGQWSISEGFEFLVKIGD